MDIFEIVLFAVEFHVSIITVWIGLMLLVRPSIRLAICMSLPVILVLALCGVAFGSYLGEDYGVHSYDASLPSLRVALERYVATGEGDPNRILESGKFKPSFGWAELSYLMRDLLRHTLLHSDDHNAGNVVEGYNKGNEWFEAMLGESMVYTCGIYKEGNESLLEAQRYKLDYVANAIDLRKDDHVLDIGCGWGFLAKYFSETYGAKVTGITLSADQLAYGRRMNAENENVTLLLQDGMTHHMRSDLPKGGYDKITSLEMAEHVGIKRYQQFLTGVRGMLKDDGVLYFQVAGLRRWWQYEDLAWGLFMGEHVFPGADASCPVGWVSMQLERAGFEVQRVQNLGTHYSRTLGHWLEEWKKSKDMIERKYGTAAWRRWEVFLRWSVRVARQGSSTLFMITATKAGDEPARIATQSRLAPVFNMKK